ncbi:hypothetical protein ABZW30_07115 [Kitasatospora sp. NPDC004669]|uniref:hypothetical protein n=1 Tax=Kitasatospora sp. NPDC004669 TaxID=3154555 RepID=UPI0033A1DB01
MTGLPLSAYQADDQTSVKEIQARNVLVVSCMHRAGFAAFSGDGLQAAQPPDDATALPAGPWGYLGAQAAATLGFHPPKRTAPRPNPAPAGAGEAYDNARVDCDRQTAERLGSPPAAGGELVSRLFDESIKAAAKDARVVAATKEWTACMSAAGFEATTPEELSRRYQATPEPTPAELAAARADADCTVRSNLAGLWFAALAGYQRQLIDRNAEALAAQKEAVRAQDAKLTQLIAGEGKG